jgi:hypothetical protein
VALADQRYTIKKTTIRTDTGADKFELSFQLEEKEQTPPIPFTVDDLIAGLNYLKTQQSVPGTARIGGPVSIALRWE